MRKHLFVALFMSLGLPFSGQMLANAAQAPQQEQGVATITGTVLDENNEPVIGASIVPKGQKNGVTTDAFGHFSVKVAAGTPLRISYVGYKAVDMPAAPSMTCYLQPTTEQLDQLVVVGYGTQKKANLTGAVATVDVARVVDSRPVTDVTKALQGAVPGLTITSADGAINNTSSIKIRGTGTLSNSEVSNPLIVVDGVPTEDISFLNPDDIQDISVLKDAASSAIYGTRAAFGVILITTKTPATKDRVSLKYTNNFAWSQATKLGEFSNVPTSLAAHMQQYYRDGSEGGFFGLQFEYLIPYAQAWYEQNKGQKAGRRVMQPFQSWDNVGDYYYDPDRGVNLYYADWDVTGIMMNNAAPSQKHNVSLEGTSGKTQYRLSFGYDGAQGLMNYNPEKLKRYTANASISTEIFSWLKAGARFSFTNKEFQQPMFGVSGAGSYIQMWRWSSWWTVLGQRADNQGDLHEYRFIAAREQGGTKKYTTTDTKVQAWMEAQLLKKLTLRADFTFDAVSLNENSVYGAVYSYNTWQGIGMANPLYEWSSRGSSDTRQYNTKQTSWNTNVYATYADTFAEKHNLKVMAGFTADQHNSNYFGVQVDYLSDYNKPYLALATGGSSGTGKYIANSITANSSCGFFGRVNYDYNGIYLLEGNVRYDGSSRFPANDQWAVFPSVSAGYRFSEEKYFEPLKHIVSNGKIRASYGHIGNEAVGNYMFIPEIKSIAAGSVYWLNGSSKVNMFNTPQLVSNTLTWERIITTDFGLDLGFFKNSLNLTFDWFQRDTKDMLAPGNTLPATLGAGAPYLNEGALRTRGWELGLSWNHSFGDADVYANFNIYDGKTKVVKYTNDTKMINSFYSGQTYGDIWGFETERYFEESDFIGKNPDGSWIYKPGVADQTGLERSSAGGNKFVFGPGDIKYKDRNGDGVIDGGKGTADNHGDLKVIGNTTPRYEYSFRLGGAWKGFDLDMFFQGVGRRQMWSTSAFIIPFANSDNVTYANQESYNKIIYDDAHNVIGYEINQNNDYPCLSGGNDNTGAVPGVLRGVNNFYPQSKYLMNMAYLRFKTLTIGYTLPVEWTKKALIQKARIYFSVDNLCLLYDGMKKYPLDPEIGSVWTRSNQVNNTDGQATYGYFGRREPMKRTFSVGMQVTF